jgi:tripartite motif-containing protein 71
VESIDVDLPLCAAWKKEGVTVAGREDGTPGDAIDELRRPTGLYVAKDRTLYVADRGNHRVMIYPPNGSRNGTPIGDGRGNGSRHLNSPTAVAVDEATNAVYISDFENQRIQLWSDGGLGLNVATMVEMRGQNGSSMNIFYRADDIQLDPRLNDTLYILDRRNARVSRWRLNATHYDSSFVTSERSLGIYVDAQRNVYVAHCDENQILQWPSSRRIAGTGQNGSALNQLKCPSSVTVDRDGSIFIADTHNHRIVRWYRNASQGLCIVGCSSTRGTRTDQLAEPADLTFDLEGNLLVADTANHRVQRFDLFINESCGEYRGLKLNREKDRAPDSSRFITFID